MWNRYVGGDKVLLSSQIHCLSITFNSLTYRPFLSSNTVALRFCMYVVIKVYFWKLIRQRKKLRKGRMRSIFNLAILK